MVEQRRPPVSQPLPSRHAGLNHSASQALAQAGAALDAGRLAEAEQAWRMVARNHPRHAEVLRLGAGLAAARGDNAMAISAMQQALAQRPRDPLYHNTMGMLLGSAGDFDAAIVALRHACHLQPQLAMAWYNLGVMLTRCVRSEEAIVALRQAVQHAPEHHAARCLLADMLRTEGRLDEARAEYRSVLADAPWFGMAWWGLADTRQERFSREDIAQMRAMLRHAPASEDDRVATGFALGKALDDAGDDAEAMQAWAHANAVARRMRSWNSSAFDGAMQAIGAAFERRPEVIDAALGEGVIFVVSLPRSGSTLVEQILASHTQVEGSGELPDLPLVLGDESRRRGMAFPQWVGSTSPADWQRLGQRYLQRTAYWQRHRPRFVDKLPNNWRYVEAICAMLPGAKIVVARRDPLETCFSCYRQYLINNEYTRTFADLADYWRVFDRRVAAAVSRHPQQVFFHAYEALLAEPETQVRQLLKFVGLPFEPACVAFHENQRIVRSPSATQVREPLRRDRARAERYGGLLDPLRDALGLAPWSAG